MAIIYLQTVFALCLAFQNTLVAAISEENLKHKGPISAAGRPDEPWKQDRIFRKVSSGIPSNGKPISPTSDQVIDMTHKMPIHAAGRLQDASGVDDGIHKIAINAAGRADESSNQDHTTYEASGDFPNNAKRAFSALEHGAIVMGKVAINASGLSEGDNEHKNGKHADFDGSRPSEAAQSFTLSSQLHSDANGIREEFQSRLNKSDHMSSTIVTVPEALHSKSIGSFLKLLIVAPLAAGGLWATCYITVRLLNYCRSRDDT